MTEHSLASAFKTAREYGLGEFLEIISELSQESTKKGHIDRKHKELITLGIALAKDCHRCIEIHKADAKKLGATDAEIQQVLKMALYTQALPEEHQEPLWRTWEDSWREFALSRGAIEKRHRELIGLGIALVKQHKRLIAWHAQAALAFGAKPEELFEIVPITLLMDGAPALSQIPHLTKVLEQSTAISTAA
ncbi:MAG: carboxymuconolactone decarboxylase family protein [Thiofilum sp.]|uniref:carboxymuconolactone decarboxylase family protein n=1 Tax=Thiofilum sp. TaxID=2212733 RepID=UPI0025D60833|nr:carboxymuconolactone decarboxylase family protein [Thiofilum sp.]MBK8452011.1 carboxymuconolactone decarboxylase family protein [Thiofilum sp.]